MNESLVEKLYNGLVTKYHLLYSTDSGYKKLIDKYSYYESSSSFGFRMTVFDLINEVVSTYNKYNKITKTEDEMVIKILSKVHNYHCYVAKKIGKVIFVNEISKWCK